MKKIDWLWLAVLVLSMVMILRIFHFMLALDDEFKTLNQASGLLWLALFGFILLKCRPWNGFFWLNEPKKFKSYALAKKYLHIKQDKWMYMIIAWSASLLLMQINRDIALIGGFDAKALSEFMHFVTRNWMIICFWLLASIWALKTVNYLQWIPPDRINGECH